MEKSFCQLRNLFKLPFSIRKKTSKKIRTNKTKKECLLRDAILSLLNAGFKIILAKHNIIVNKGTKTGTAFKLKQSLSF